MNKTVSGRRGIFCVAAALSFLGSPLAMVAGSVSSSQAEPIRAKGLTLLSVEEADELRINDAQWPAAMRPRSTSMGPRIVFERPTTNGSADEAVIQMATPTDLLVRFKQNRSAVDMESLEVRARKGFFSKPLTKRLMPYVRGTELEVEKLVLPEGRFLVEIRIADIEGQVTTATYRLHVSKR